ncbi:MAG: L-threonylcarbamoyladenylate synthase [Candidatus Dojkabacteria bacterium]
MENISDAAKAIRAGQLVVFPTETVYGLGANALDPDAVKKIFLAKGRPADNPLIMHIACKEGIWDYADKAQLTKDEIILVRKLIQKYWPGPLTLVLPKKKIVPEVVTAGGDNIAIRMPDNKIALSLIAEANTPIAAPSANLSGRPSPTRVEHVLNSPLKDEVAAILDGGPCEIGLESTVAKIEHGKLKLLRPGAVVFSDKDLANPKESNKEQIKVESPGMKYRHYAPSIPVKLLSRKEIEQAKSSGGIEAGIYLISLDKFGHDLDSYARNLFSELIAGDESGAEEIWAETVEKTGIGSAIMNRLEKAAMI